MGPGHATRTRDRFELGGMDEAASAELEAVVDRILAQHAGRHEAEPGWLSESFDAAWTWLMLDPLAF